MCSTERNFPAVDIKLLDEEEALGQLDQVNDEPAFIQGVLPEHLEGVDFAFLTADESFIAKVWASVRDCGSEIIDLSYALENNTDVALRAPWVEKELGHSHEDALQSGPVVIAHPAAVVLALLLGRLQTVAPLRIASAVIGQPASEYGRRGMDELHDQTINLLSFQQLPTACFGTQVAFNLFVQSNETACPSLAQSEARILRHFRAMRRKGCCRTRRAAGAGAGLPRLRHRHLRADRLGSHRRGLGSRAGRSPRHRGQRTGRFSQQCERSGLAGDPGQPARRRRRRQRLLAVCRLR